MIPTIAAAGSFDAELGHEPAVLAARVECRKEPLGGAVAAGRRHGATGGKLHRHGLLEHAPGRERAVEDDPALPLGLDGSDVPLARRQVAERAGVAEVAVVAAADAPAQDELDIGARR